MKSLSIALLVAACLMSAAAMGQQPARDQAKGPLRVHPTNPRYFTDGIGNPDGSLRAIYLTGSHAWDNLLDIGTNDPPKAFDFDAYLDFLVRHDHNFIRLWTRDHTTWIVRAVPGAVYHAAPQPWQRSGPGLALDGKSKFNFEKFDPAYFERLRARVQAAGQRGIYVSVMLFEGWELSFSSWDSHPFHIKNNVQEIDGDPNGDGKGLEIQTLTIPKITAAQEAYVRKVIDTVNDLDNVLYEISNESRLLDPASSTKDWQYHLIRFIKNEEANRPKQHPVGMTSQGYGGGDDSEILLNSPADWISPNPDKSDYKNNPPASDGKKVILLDTDHLWGIGGNAAWVWKSFLHGHNPIFMDPYDHYIPEQGPLKQWDGVRLALGATRGLAKRIDLAKMTPSLDLASTKYCLAKPGQEYLVYQPGTGEFSVNLAAGSYALEWFNPAAGAVASTGSVKATGGNQAFTPPFSGPAVLYLKVASAEPGAASRTTPAPKLGISADKFTIGGQPTFLLGVSYFDALGWSNADLDALQARRFNLIRIFLDWGIRPGGNRTRSHFNPDGSMKNTTNLLTFVRACAARGIIVDVTVLSSDSKSLGDWTSGAFPQTAVRNAVRLLAPEPNVFFDLVNEHNGFSATGKMDSWSDSHTTMQSLMTAARQESGSAILTYSSMSATFPNYAGHVYTANDSMITANIDQELATGVDLMAPHPGREDDWFDRTDRRVTNLKNYMASRGRLIPVYLQEENRSGGGDATGEPLRNLPKEQFFQAAREAKNAGAAAWLFHTDAGFDMTAKNFLDHLDPVEREVVSGLGGVVFGPDRNLPLRSEPAAGPLRKHPTNGRYFTDGSGKAIYLTGSHTWANLVDNGIGVGAPLSMQDPPPAFDYTAYLNLLQTNNHNFIRLWRWELPKTFHSKGSIYFTQPHPWLRSGPGIAHDGKPKFDLNRLDRAYFDRLRSRVIAARDRGIYVGIMLFEGWHLLGTPTSWQYHPFHGSNNVNGINGDANGNGQGEETHTLQVPAVMNVQQAYVRKVIDTVNDLDNVLYEIANESAVAGSTQWQSELINFIKSYEAAKPKQHPVGMTSQAWSLGAKHNLLWNSPADWVSLGQITRFENPNDPYISDPPLAPGGKVSILDTDHLGWKVFVNDAALSRAWVWKSFLRGHNPELMEDLENNSGWIAARAAMGHTRTYANKLNLAAMTPQNGLSTTAYCLAKVGSEYLAYQPESGSFAVNLVAGTYALEWFNPATGAVPSAGSVKATGGNQTFTPPFSSPAVLYLKATDNH